jgi:4,5:9,10-diseco-3-hydroxy-5,9,17-trioxoandrosta-1(10),2-diene-4-oate hydrolase
MPLAPPACLVEIDGVTLAVDRAGRGAPVVCLHSVGHDGRDFDPLVDRCGDAFEFVRVDWPGHGRSGPDRVPASAARYAAILDGLLQRLGIDNPLLIGNSIGGAAAIAQAARRRARGLVLCDSGGLVAVDATVKAVCGLFERFFAAGESGAFWYPAAFALYYRLVLPRPEARDRRLRVVGQARDMAPVLRQAWASFSRPEADLREAAASLDIPIWAAWAKHDRVIPLSRVRPALDRLRNVRLSLFEGGHTPFLEEPDAFAAQFRAFAAPLS